MNSSKGSTMSRNVQGHSRVRPGLGALQTAVMMLKMRTLCSQLILYENRAEAWRDMVCHSAPRFLSHSQ